MTLFTAASLTIDGESFPSTKEGNVIVKLDATGHLAWAKRLGFGVGGVVRALPGGDILYVGYHAEDFSFFGDYAPEGTSRPNVICTARLDADGNKKWSACSSSMGSCDIRPSSVEVVGSSFYIAGSVNSGDCALPTTSGSDDETRLTGVYIHAMGYVARFDLTTGAWMTTSEFPVDAPHGTDFSRGFLQPLSDGSLRAVIVHQGAVRIDDSVESATQPLLLNLDLATLKAASRVPLGLPPNSVWKMSTGYSNTIVVSGLANGQPVDGNVIAGGAYMATVDTSDGHFEGLRSWDVYAGTDLTFGGARPIHGRVAFPTYFSDGVANKFGAGVFAPPGSSIGINMLSADGSFLRVDYLGLTSKSSGNITNWPAVQAIVPTDDGAENLLLAGTTSYDVDVFGTTLANPAGLSDTVWVARVVIPNE